MDVSDAAGHHYSLRPGVSAEVKFPIAPSRLRADIQPPAEIAMWAYDSVTGNWRPHGMAERQGTIWDTIYDGSMSSAVAGSGIAQLAEGCLLVSAQVNDESIGVAVQATPVGSPRLPPFPITGTSNLLIPVPVNTPLALALVNDLGDDVPTAEFLSFPSMSPLAGDTAQSGNPLPGPALCSSEVILSLNVPTWAGYPSSQFLEQNLPAPTTPTAGDNFTNSYYGLVDPKNKRTTLGAWWAQNGFNSNGVASGDTLATYLNTNELGVGSYVRCSQSSNHATTACYMTIYGSPDGDPGNANLAYHAIKSSASATLAMELSPVEDNPPTAPMAKFFAYGGPNANSPRVSSVDLDGLGARYVPSVCVACHGGGYFSVPNNVFTDVTQTQVYASFREFDRSTLMSPSGHDQSAALDKLNALVLQGNPTYGGGPQYGSTIAELIKGWYETGTFNPDFVPPGWNDTDTDQNFYLNAVAKSCRTCHDAFDSGVNGISWDIKTSFVAEPGEQQGFVCGGPGGVMPNALMTYINFWLNDRQDLFQNFFLWPTGCPLPQ